MNEIWLADYADECRQARSSRQTQPFLSVQTLLAHHHHHYGGRAMPHMAAWRDIFQERQDPLPLGEVVHWKGDQWAIVGMCVEGYVLRDNCEFGNHAYAIVTYEKAEERPLSFVKWIDRWPFINRISRNDRVYHRPEESYKKFGNAFKTHLCLDGAHWYAPEDHL